MNVSNNIHQIPCLVSADLTEEWTVEEKIPIKTAPAPAKKEEPKKEENAEAKPEGGDAKPEEEVKQEAPQAEQQYETKTRKKSSTSPI